MRFTLVVLFAFSFMTAPLFAATKPKLLFPLSDDQQSSRIKVMLAMLAKKQEELGDNAARQSEAPKDENIHDSSERIGQVADRKAH